MARNITTTYPANLPLTEEETEAREQFIHEFTEEYQISARSDLRLLGLAATEYIKSVRLQTQELATGHVLGNLRFHPIAELVRLLGMMDATRAAKLRSKQPTNEEESEMLRFLMDYSAMPTRRNNHEK